MSVSLLDGHYSLKLSCRKDDVQIPNNRLIAMQRLLNLKRKFNRNESFYKEWCSSKRICWGGLTSSSLRLLWWPNGDTEHEPVDYRMLVHIFGAVSSPSCASFALRRTAEDNLHIRSQVTDTIKQNFYVDDCLKSVPIVEEAVDLRS